MTATKKSLYAIFSMLVLVMLLAACAGGGNDPDTNNGSGDVNVDTDTDTDVNDTDVNNTDESENNEEANTGEETALGGNDLIIATLSDASSLDPHGSNDVPSSNVQENIFETLVNRDANNEIVPGLAESWDAVDDTTWSFTLREGIMFHDGEEFNAEVVKMNLDRIRDAEIGSPRLFLFEMISDVEVISEYEVEITTEFPFSPVLAHLSHNGGGMISPASIEADYAAMEDGSEPGSVIATEPIGTGYFQFDSWNPGDEIVLVKNDDYWDTPANVDSVTFRVVPDSQTRAADLETGNVHIIDPVQPNEVERINNSGVASVLETDSSSLAYLGFNTEKEPFDNPLVRQAISYAVNREAIITGVYDDFGLPAISPLAPNVFGYTDEIDAIEYDLEYARELLAEAGMEDGFSTTIWTNDNPQRESIAILVQESLADLNIEVEIEVMEFGAYLEDTAAGEHDMFILGWSNPTGDADYGLYALFHSNQKGDPGNRSFYENAEVDSLLDEARQETDPERREEIYAEVQQFLTDDAPMAFLLHTAYLNGIADTVTGFDITDSGIFQLKDVEINE